MANVIDFDAAKQARILKERAIGLLRSGDLTEAQSAIGELTALVEEHGEERAAERARCLSDARRLLDDGRVDEAIVQLSALKRASANGATKALWRATELVEPTRALIARIQSGAEAPVETGFSQLDEQLDGGLWPGLHMLVSGTGNGKTQLAMQTALHAARQGVPVFYVIMEMTPDVGMLRIMGELAGVSWSNLMRKRSTAEELERVERAFAEVPNHLSFENAQPYAWPVARVHELARLLRAERPEGGPALLIVDYTQLCGDDSDETRQRVMAVCIAMQRSANQFRLATLAVSSTARPGYAALADIVKRGALGDEPSAYGGVRRVVRAPSDLIGLGKESGEIEYSAESVTVLGAGGWSEETGRIVVAATVKRRTGEPAWCPLRFEKGRLSEAREIQRVEDLPLTGAAGEATSETAREQKADACHQAVTEAIRENPGMSATAIEAAVRGHRRESVRAHLALLVDTGRVERVARAGRGGGHAHYLAEGPELRPANPAGHDDEGSQS